MRFWQLFQLEVCGLPTCISASQHHEDSKRNGHRLPRFLLDEDYSRFLTSRLGGMVFRMLRGLVNNTQRIRGIYVIGGMLRKSRWVNRSSRYVALSPLIEPPYMMLLW